ncbi:hypothetical protein [uncultured Microbulbifer sp.]|uniref:hypothetical protein n=1 Tax=uncultured Microbulbifer sp. TaxID=348147 RepID=UPI002608E366|nr:hypothetical protein [uncultured Microbulbifer sp.]
MFKSVGLFRLRLVGRHVEGASYDLDDARLASALEGVGLAAKLYRGRPEGRVRDIARQLIRMRTDILLMWVALDSLMPALRLCEALLAFRPNIRIYWWGEDTDSSEVKEHARNIATLIPAPVPEQVLPMLQELGFLSTERKLPAVLPSPYMSGVVPSAEEAIRLGLTADVPADVLNNEVTWLRNARLDKQSTIPVDAKICSAESLHNLIQVLSGLPCSYILQVDIQALVGIGEDQLPAEGLSKIRVSGEEGQVPDRIQKKANKLGITIEFFESKEELSQKAMRYANNGIFALHTGVYTDLNQMPGIYHIEVPLHMDMQKRQAAYQWAGANMALRSAAVVFGDTDLALEHITNLQPPVCQETSGWPKHTYALSLGENGDANAIFDGNPANSKQLRYVPYREFDFADTVEGCSTVVTMKTAEDVAAFERNLAQFHSKGEITLAHPNRPVSIENSCRWLRYGNCRVSLLRRLSVGEDMNIKACRDAGTIGTTQDTYDQLITKVKQQQQIEEVQRNCTSCPVRDDCSHCIHLPNAWAGRYCEIRKTYGKTAQFFEMAAFPYLIAHLLHNNSDPIVAKVSDEGLPSRHYKGEVGETRQGARPTLVTVLDQHFSWWRGSRKIIRLSEPLMTMTEAWWNGASEQQIAQELSAKFGVDSKIAQESLSKGLEKLRSEGVTHG